VIFRVGAGNSGSGAPSAAISIQSISPFSQLLDGREVDVAGLGGGCERDVEVVRLCRSQRAALNSIVLPVTVPVQPGLSTTFDVGEPQ